MRIVTNVSALQVYEDYSQNQLALANSMEKLSTGLRINRAVDDPAGLAISEALRAQVNGTNSVVDVIANATIISEHGGWLSAVRQRHAPAHGHAGGLDGRCDVDHLR